MIGKFACCRFELPLNDYILLTVNSKGDETMVVEPQKEHRWLHKLIGE